jgi:hypothetical protein
MEYKTTYFQISLNNEISINSSDYDEKINNSRIIETISKINNYTIGKKININSSISDLQQLQKDLQLKKIEYFNAEGLKHRSNIIKNISTLINEIDLLIKLKTQHQNSTNRRFTEKHEKELNIHLNENAKDGWKLFSMNPIIKGYKEKGLDYGLGHDVTEGFVMVWEK